jgi:hypothetical protein
VTAAERGLLLYLETRAVDYSGGVAPAMMNEADFAIAKRWNDEGYIKFGRIYSGDIPQATTFKTSTNWVELSEKAWQDAHAERRARAERMWAKRTFRKTSEVS